MDQEAIRQDFALRMHELCDALSIPRGHGRNAALGREFNVTPNAARKWLLGLAYPEMPLAVQMCERAGVNLLWLLQGTGPRRGDQVDPHVLGLGEALRALPVDKRTAILDFVRFQIEQTGSWFTEQAKGSYLQDIEALRGAAAAPPSKRDGTHG